MALLLLMVLTAILLASLWQYKLPPKSVSELVTGVIPEDPSVLAEKAGVDLEVYTLARIAQSEEGLSGDRAKIAVMYAAKHRAESAGKTVTEIATAGNPKRSDYAVANGRYGRQGIHPYCSTIANPTPHTLDLAYEVSVGIAIDETQGAEYWDNPLTQNAKHLVKPYDESTGKGYRSSEEIAERRKASGLRLINIAGISTRFWVR